VYDSDGLRYDLMLLLFIVTCVIRRQGYYMCIILCVILRSFLSPSCVINV